MSPSIRASLLSHRLDYLVIGGGFSGLNAMSALKRANPHLRAVCVDPRPGPGGSWNEFYSFVRLHNPHPMFGVDGHSWGIPEPTVLASKEQVLHHFTSFVDGAMPAGFAYAGGVRYECLMAPALPGTGGSPAPLRVSLQSEDTGEEFIVDAFRVIDARGFDYAGHMKADQDPRSDGSTRGRELMPGDLPELLQAGAEAAAPGAGPGRLFVVVGGGKMGIDTAGFLVDHVRAEDSIVLITGTPKWFSNRDMIVGHRKPTHSFLPTWSQLTQPTFAQMVLDMALKWDGHNAEEVLLEQGRRGTLISVAGPGRSYAVGLLSEAEKARVEQHCRVVVDDHFRGADFATRAGLTSTVRLQSGESIDTTKELVIVNCRTSGAHRATAFTRPDAHPLRPDGRIEGSSTFGLTGVTSFLLGSLVELKGQGALERLPLFGNMRHGIGRSGYDPDHILGFLVRSFANILSASDILGPRFMSAHTLDPNKWYHPAKQVLELGNLLTKRKALEAQCLKHCRIMEAYEPDPVAGADGRVKASSSDQLASVA
mmetsp:Transcript_17801/g.46048  ORF Transcript_17801/g.46048 Transcript_17801/m.46048 type:complete len:538 (+) Transcript_17801:58-1671(+)|eukprot:CAMPEP_0119414000 /NCGR_PEP_ID=MMETSP1335-20130426/6348_1 /TAXON_ID=259385 /ORGANISM="Chrysoculter rhomboideus, Strain RCC1486" /LENGTH=537 /DNA_ID=CAMNT_0007438847 /DNA_START=47 /DNA_END=1660 /DNA_ORIENTATION=+